jgi:hypothetical protein
MPVSSQVSPSGLRSAASISSSISQITSRSVHPVEMVKEMRRMRNKSSEFF